METGTTDKYPVVFVSHETMQSQIDAAVLAEREACAKIAESFQSWYFGPAIAEQIRARSKK